MSNCGCTTQVELCVIKGTNFETAVSFSKSFVEVIEDPDLYEGILVFREWQDDSATVYLTLRVDVAPIPPEVPAAMVFKATPTQTLALPDWDVVAYCNLQLKDGTSIDRLYNAEVCVS